MQQPDLSIKKRNQKELLKDADANNFEHVLLSVHGLHIVWLPFFEGLILHEAVGCNVRCIVSLN